MEYIARRKLDGIVVDLRVQGGLELIKSLKCQFANLRILILSQYDAPLYVERALRAGANPVLLYSMVAAQGFLGYSMTSVFGPVVAEIFEGPHFGAIFGTLMVFAIGGGAVGPWVTGLLHDQTGNYDLAFYIALGFSVVSAITIFIAAPRKVRLVAGRMAKRR